MDISPRSGYRRASEPVDDWLRNEGYFRKNAAHDATCLFRAVSEQIYLTQYYHLKVREQCVDFMRDNKELFEEKVKIPFDNYLDQLSCVTQWGSNVEIQAIAQLYKRDIVIFNATKLERYMATDNGFKKFIYLCQMGYKVYESVFKRDMISTAAYCQSIMYQTLYKSVFNMPSIDTVVQTMLHERTSNIRHEKFFLKTNLDHRDHLTTELLTKIDTKGSTSPSKSKTDRAPFPYRIAKALDPNIYRNIDFDIWQEMRKEVRWSGWTRWNDSKLQIGAKCLVQLDDSPTNQKNINKTTTNPQEITSALVNQDQNGNPQENPSKKGPALSKGHIQEMSENEGPVVVFIEELGEKRTVPFTSLKPLLASHKPHLPLGVISPRKNFSHDTQKYRPKYSQPKKPKDSTHTSLDSLNNNEHHDKPPKNRPSPSTDPPPPQNSKILLKPFTSVDNYQSNNIMNTIEVRPVSIILDNPQPLMTPGNDSRMEKEEVNNPKPSVSPMNNNNNLMINNNNLSQLDAYEKSQGQVQPQGQPQGQVNEGNNVPPALINPLNHPSTHQEPQGTFYPQIYPQPPNIMCVPSEGMYPVQYYQQQEVLQAPPAIQDRSLRPINISAGISTDVNGADLPYSDPVTLRFFYNLGIETFRCGHMWPTGSMAYVPQGNVVSAVASAGPPEAPQGVQTGQRREEEQARGYQGKRRTDERIERNSGRNSGNIGDSRGNYRGNYSRREQGNGNSSGYEYKNKNYGGEDKEGRDGRDQRDQRKNGNRFNGNNNNNKKIDHRVRNFERNNTFQGYQVNFRGDNGTFRRPQNEQVQGNVQGSGQGTSNVGNQQFQGNYQQQSGFNEQQTVYYPSEGQGFYPPPNANFYPVGFMPPPSQEGNESSGYVGICGTGENFQPPMTNMYPQYIYPPGIYPGVNAGGEGNWYPLAGGQGFVPYQVPVSQPPPNMVRPPTSS